MTLSERFPPRTYTIIVTASRSGDRFIMVRVRAHSETAAMDAARFHASPQLDGALTMRVDAIAD